MASLIQHMQDCRRLIGDDCEDVNRWIDEFFGEFGPFHRFKRHHREGIQEAEALFGTRGRQAATVHILRDCRNIPREQDYVDGTVDRLGLIAKWPVTAYIRYPNDAFERLVMYSLNGPEAVLNLGFIKSQDDLLRLFMTQAVADESQRDAALQRWPSSIQAKNELAPLADAVINPLTEKQQAYIDELSEHPLMRSIREQFPSVTIQAVDIGSLINPLVWIDLEYVEELRAELVGTEDIDAIRFAFPTQININTRISVDTDGRGVSLISQQKQLAVTPPMIGQLPGVGMTVTFNVIGTPQLILVSRVNGRLYLKNGMHRAYLLASTGIRNIPALIVDENVLSQVSTMYPAFNPETLESERPPVLEDMFMSDLTAHIQIVRTKKVVRIRVDETLLPVD
jgi:hypothetical protein